MSRQPVAATAGRTHASSVIPDVNRNAAASATVTRELDPLNDNAFPNLPAADHAAFATVPVRPFPDASTTDTPDPASNPYAATRLGVAAVPMRGVSTSRPREKSTVSLSVVSKKRRDDTAPDAWRDDNPPHVRSNTSVSPPPKFPYTKARRRSALSV